MIDRYADPRITKLWSLEEKYRRWQQVELTVISAREQLRRIPEGTYGRIEDLLLSTAIDQDIITSLEAELHHDYNAFLGERKRLLPPELAQHFHDQGMTSYDGEEVPFAQTLMESCEIVQNEIVNLSLVIKDLIKRYRYTPYLDRTHGQWAEVQSFGRKCISWHQDLAVANTALTFGMVNLEYSKLSGMIGSNSGMDSELEAYALELLGFKPWIGATQIMPRALYSPIASALSDIASACEKVSYDIWLGSRSGRPLWHEPFGKKQKGSSAGPNKKNPINCEQNIGMASMARHDSACIKDTIVTAEGRDISQSCVERVKWPDLFHVTLRAIKNLTKVLRGLVVYPDNMMVEIIESRGTYGASRAKDVLAKLGLPFGLTSEDAYRILQLASFEAFAPSEYELELRNRPPWSVDDAIRWLSTLMDMGGSPNRDLPTIQQIIPSASLHTNPGLEASAETVERWNGILRQIFETNSGQKGDHWQAWSNTFSLANIMANESHQFEAVLKK